MIFRGIVSTLDYEMTWAPKEAAVYLWIRNSTMFFWGKGSKCIPVIYAFITWFALRYMTKGPPTTDKDANHATICNITNLTLVTLTPSFITLKGVHYSARGLEAII